LTALFGLVLLSAIAVGLVYLANTETMVNYNYRNEQVAYFAAKAGVEEARDRMMPANANYFGAGAIPIAPPGGVGGVLYLLNEGSAPGTVQPWTLGNAYVDDELCHDGYSLSGLQSTQPDVRCTTVPSSTGWYTTAASTAPWSGTAAAVAYKWVRIAVKVNNSEQDYPVNSGGAAATQVCWNGANEKLLTAATCQAMSPSMTPVYLITALGVSLNGARKVVQAEVALAPSQGFIYGMFATGTTCSAVNLAGGATTDSFTSASGGTYVATKTSTGGDIGSNGNVGMSGGVQVGGAIGVLAVSPATVAAQGACPLNNYTTNGGAGMVSNAANVLNTLTSAVTLPLPPAPNPTPPTTDLSFSGGSKSASLVPGTYGNIKVTGGVTLTMAPGVYNINSISLAGGSTVVISPAGQVVLNVAGSGASTPVDFTGGSVSNTSRVANNFQINYSGTGTVKVSGGASSYVVVYAPNAAITIQGGSDIYGAIAGKTIDDSGGVNFHYDRNVQLATTSSAGSLTMISFRDVAY